MTKLVYALVAIADVVVMGLFYGPSSVGVSLRFISGFDDLLPRSAFVLLCISVLLILLLLSKELRMQVIKGFSSLLCIAAISIYVIVASLSFAGIFFLGT